ncbi:MAG: DUF4279 domain-containing protein [Leptospiraceae bacterium]|nr:DUF4279 domain-containing protein [Leptospiraceae bacterium]MDW7976566.1 DUF4279 domain-containing protein [Leptospiraceae bacterium]
MKNWAIFSIKGTGLISEEITKFLEIKPDRVLFDEKEGIESWELISKSSGDESIVKHIEELLEKIYPLRKKIQNLSHRYEIRFICTIQREAMEFIEIPPKYLLILGSLGVKLIIYC